MRASFSSRDADNHTAFIRIKTNASNEDEFIILPVEVEVTTGQDAKTYYPCIFSYSEETLTKYIRFFSQHLVYTLQQRC